MFLLLVNLSIHEYVVLNKPSETNYPISVLMSTAKLFDWDIIRDVIETFTSGNFDEDMQSYFNLQRIYNENEECNVIRFKKQDGTVVEFTKQHLSWKHHEEIGMSRMMLAKLN